MMKESIFCPYPIPGVLSAYQEAHRCMLGAYSIQRTDWSAHNSLLAFRLVLGYMGTGPALPLTGKSPTC